MNVDKNLTYKIIMDKKNPPLMMMSSNRLSNKPLLNQVINKNDVRGKAFVNF